MLCFGHNSVIVASHWHPTSLKSSPTRSPPSSTSGPDVHLVGYFWLDKNIIWWQNDTKQLPWMAEMENIQRGVLVSFLLGWLGTIPAWVGLLFIVISTTINFFMFHLFVALFGLQIKRLPRWFKTPSHRCVNFLLLVPTVQHSLDGTRWC